MGTGVAMRDVLIQCAVVLMAVGFYAMGFLHGVARESRRTTRILDGIRKRSANGPDE